MFSKKLVLVAAIVSFLSVGLLLVVFAPAIEAQSLSTAQLVYSLINKPKIYQVIQTDPYLKDAFCNKPRDVLLFAYCEGNELSNIASPGNTNLLRKPLMYDFFTDGEFSTNPYWVSASSVSDWIVSNQKLSTNGPKQNATLFTDLSGGQLIPFTDVTIWHFKAKVIGNNGEKALYRFVNNSNNPVNFPKGYHLDATIGSNWKMAYQDWTSGILNTLIDSGLPVISNQEYDLLINRNSTGNYTWYIDGQLVGSIQDNNATSIRSFGLQTGNTPVELHLDDVNISITDFGHMPSGFFNLNDWNNTSGVRCQIPGTARLTCLSQT